METHVGAFPCKGNKASIAVGISNLKHAILVDVDFLLGADRPQVLLARADLIQAVGGSVNKLAHVGDLLCCNGKETVLYRLYDWYF